MTSSSNNGQYIMYYVILYFIFFIIQIAAVDEEGSAALTSSSNNGQYIMYYIILYYISYNIIFIYILIFRFQLQMRKGLLHWPALQKIVSILGFQISVEFGSHSEIWSANLGREWCYRRNIMFWKIRKKWKN